MGGGLMNLIANGSANIILNGNPSKTFFVAKYNKYTNFGLQRIRLSYTGQRKLDFADETIMEFKIPRNADLLHDTYLVVTMPDIWSSIYGNNITEAFVPYEFRWVENFACAMIKSITVRSGGNIISQYSGEYLYCMRERDHTSKYALWNRMSGNVPHFTDPANAYGRPNQYPTAIYDPSNSMPSVIEPSIRGGKIYIPIETWFSKTGKMALPLVAMQYQETYIEIKFNPISHLYTIRDIDAIDASGGYPRIAPDPTKDAHSFYRFVNPPEYLTAQSYSNTVNSWNGDIHLLATYVWLDKKERAVFARDNQSYLIKNVSEVEYKNVNGMRTIDIISKNLVANWMFRFRRTDVEDRNQWFNYSNWPVKDVLPTHATDISGSGIKSRKHTDGEDLWVYKNGPEIFFYNKLHEENIKEILIDFSIKMDGKIREDNLPAGVYKWVEKFNRTSGIAEDGIYCYNFGLNNSSYDIQPSGAMNVNKFNKIQFEFSTINPPIDVSGVTFSVQCDDQSGDIVGVQKDLASMYKYSFDLLVMEERYNVVEVTAGRMGLKYAR
tara:strand:+ start:5832 stop:7484 length:1653 start_codon:yes stop_codon:yes gene_type:complete